jgi:hypothetical protein
VAARSGGLRTPHYASGVTLHASAGRVSLNCNPAPIGCARLLNSQGETQMELIAGIVVATIGLMLAKIIATVATRD